MEIGDIVISTKLHILEHCSYDVILGKNFIIENLDSINIRDGEIIFKSQNGTKKAAELNNVKIKGNTKYVTAAKTAKREIFLPKEKKVVELYPKSDILANALRFQPRESLEKLNLEAEVQIVSGEGSKMQITLTNNTDTKITLFPNKQVGTFTIIRKAKVCVTGGEQKDDILYKLEYKKAYIGVCTVKRTDESIIVNSQGKGTEPTKFENAKF